MPPVKEIVLKEHALIETQIVKLEKAVSNLRFEGRSSFNKNVKNVIRTILFFSSKIGEHMRLEESVLFTFLETHTPRFASLICVLRSEHESIRKHFRKMWNLIRKIEKSPYTAETIGQIEQLRETTAYLVYMLYSHLEIEQKSIYQSIEKELHPDERRKLARLLKRAKHVQQNHS